MVVKSESPSGRPVRTTCPYCGVGCGVVVKAPPNGPVSVEGDREHPANYGRLCSKGSALGQTLGLDGRLLHPEVDGRRVSWDAALDLVADKFGSAIAEHGPDSVAFYVSGQLLTEDYYVANKLMKGFIGSANIDTNSRLCMASSVAGHRRAFGSDTVPGTYEDLELADLVVLVGSNLAWCHPVLYQRLRKARSERPQMRVVLIDPRRTMTEELADLHLPIVPDGDIALFAGLLNALVESDAVDAGYVDSFTTGFDDAVSAARQYSIEAVARVTGLDVADLARFYAWFCATEKTVTVYSQGVNQSAHGTDKVNAILNCHLATGRIGRPGRGPFSVTGQPNAMGGREVGGLANSLAAHTAIEDPGHRDLVKRFWNATAMPDQAGLKAVDLFEAVGDGRIKALWIMATNPVDSLPCADDVRDAIVACPFVVVSDVMAETDTTCLANVKLPSTAWGEKDGTVTNSERRISRQRSFLPPPGEARADWWQLTQVARRMGFADGFAYEDPSAIFREHAALSAFENAGSRDFDIGAHRAISRRAYAAMTPFQWPQLDAKERCDKRFFARGGFFTSDGRGRFAVPSQAGASATIPDHCFVLNTGRVRDHWHTMTRTAKSERLSAHVAEPFVELHPDDATRLGIGAADIVEIENAKGRVLVRALITDRQQRGCIFVPIHWGDQYAARARVDTLVPRLTDPVSGQPASKNAVATARRFETRQFGFAVSTNRPDTAGCDYWALAKCIGGWRLELANRHEQADVEAFARVLCGVDQRTGLECAAYRDENEGDRRLTLFDNGQFVGAVYLSRQPVAVSRTWAVEQLVHPVDRKSRHRLIAGRPGINQPDPGPIICVCHFVGANEIARSIASGRTTLDDVGRASGAGTNCGSCRAEISELIDAHRPVPAE